MTKYLWLKLKHKCTQTAFITCGGYIDALLLPGDGGSGWACGSAGQSDGVIQDYVQDGRMILDHWELWGEGWEKSDAQKEYVFRVIQLNVKWMISHCAQRPNSSMSLSIVSQDVLTLHCQLHVAVGGACSILGCAGVASCMTELSWGDFDWT